MRKINLCIVIIIVLCILLISGCQTGPTKVIAAPKVLAEFNFQGDMNHILLPVTYQGKEYQFALDTGSSYTTFDDSFKDKLGKRFLWPMKVHVLEGMGSKEVLVEDFRIDEAYLGSLRLNERHFIQVMDFDLLEPGNNFNGIIGMDFLQKHIVQIDFDNRKVIFFRGKKDFDLLSMFKPKENKHPEWGEAIPLSTKLFSNVRFVSVEFPHKIRDEFLVDTGWPNPPSLKSKIFDKVFSYNKPKDKKQDVNSPSAGSSGYALAQMIDEFSVGSFKYDNNIILRSYMSLLGMGFLSRHLVTFDFPNNMMYLKKGKNFDKPSSINVKIPLIAGCLLESENHVISSVDPNGPAYQKGVRNGDILIKICDQDISNMSFIEFFRFITQFSAPEDGKIPMIFKRGEEVFTVEFVRKTEKEIQN